jgi:hypothetical protein
MPNEIVPDETVRANIVAEYGLSLATVAEALLRYPDVMSRATSDSEKERIIAQYARVLRATLNSRPIALAVLEHSNARMAKRSGLFSIFRNVCRYLYRLCTNKDLSGRND